MNETDTKVDEALAAMGIVFTARYIGETVKWEGQTVDHYRVKIGAFETDFYQGLGHRKVAKLKPWQATPSYKVIPPTAAAVLYCLLSDMEAIGQSFTDWASDFGYDTDSRKALATYEACCDTGRELRKVFTSTQRADLRGLLQDY